MYSVCLLFQHCQFTLIRLPKVSEFLIFVWMAFASELLRTENVPASGFGENAKCVLSYQGKKPHRVIPKKVGQFSYDSDCPNFKALGICSHVVAVAETCQKLLDLVAPFIKAKKTPNLIKFTEPKGCGRKGVSCPRKRKAPGEIKTPVTSLAFTHCDNHSSSEQGSRDG